MKSSVHAITSLSIGTLIWLFTKSLYAGILCFISGFFIDIDHIIEYIIHYGWKDFNFKRFFLICEQTCKQGGEERFRKIYLVFHLGELAILLWIVSIYTKNIYLFAITIGYSIHLILDCVGNLTHPYYIFITFRAIKNFDTEKLVRKMAD